MDLSRLSTILKDQPKYRFKQVYKAVFVDLIESWQEATSLPVDLRARLEETCPLGITAEFDAASDQTVKALVTFEDGLKVETVLISHQDARNTVCVSSQVGCPLGCLFCATGRIGFKRNLTRNEIIEQVVLWCRRLKAKNVKVTNVVFMGMGEPFLNYDNVLDAIRFLNDADTMNLGARRFSISTAGITHGIRKLAGEKLEINLALSLHAIDEKLRSHIMPINGKYPLSKVMKEIDAYTQTTRRRVMYEYLLIDRLNDSEREARALAKFLHGRLGFVNLIVYNETKMFKAASPERVRAFKEILERARLSVTLRHRFGEGIDAACGQLAARPNRLAERGKARNT